MATCSYCDSFILFGGKIDQTGTYCNARCQQAGNLLALSGRVSQKELDRLVEEARHSNCPRCGGPGPIDVYKAHQVWSALLLTSWSSRPALSCKLCATKRQIGASLFSGLCGWWGFPWGLVMTPTQIIRNVVEMVSSRTDSPSPLMQKFVRLQVGAHLVQNRTAPPVQSKVTAPIRTATPPTPPPLEPVGDERYMPKV